MGMPCRFTASADYGVARAMSNKSPVSDQEAAAVKERRAQTLTFLASGSKGGVAVADGQGGHRKHDGEAARPVHAYDARRTMALLERVCVDDLACEGYELPRLKTALDIVVTWFGVGPQKGS